MGAREFRPKLAPSSAPHNFNPTSRYATFVKTVFSQNAIVLGAALFQFLFCVLLPDDFAIVPAAVLLLGYALSTLFHLTRPSLSSPSSSSSSSSAGRGAAPPSTSPYTEHVVRGRATAQLPSPSSGGAFGTDPGARGLVVFNLGVQTNHPLGFLCPGGREISTRFLEMHETLQRDRDEHGVVAANVWRGYTAENASAINVAYYFRDVEGLHRFAHGPLHRAAWDWYAQNRYPHIGVYHETFVVPPRSYETVYVNCSPVGLGSGSVLCGSEGEGEEKARWVNTLVSADMPALKTQMARLGRDEKGNEKM